MKKIYLSFLAALAIGTAAAQTFTDYTTDADLLHYGGFQSLAISPNGQYVCGATFSTYGYVYDFNTQKVFVPNEVNGSIPGDSGCQLLSVDNDGFAVGFDQNGGIMVGANESYKIIDSEGGSMPQSITPDGNLIVGCTFTSSWQTFACYWENGERIMLDTPTEAEMGFRVNGSRAIGVSDDGSVIVGYIQDRASSFPMILWFRQADGSYKLDPVCLGKFEPNITYKYAPDGSLLGITFGPNPYLDYRPACITSDGKYVAMYITENYEDINAPMHIGIYNVETGDLQIMDDSPLLKYYDNSFIITGITDDLTIIGSAGQMAEGPTPFVFYYDTKKLISITEAFPSLSDILNPLIESSMYGNPLFITGITPDGKYICGYYVYLWDANGDDLPDYATTRAFRIETANAGVGTVISDPLETKRVYNLNGVQVGTSTENLAPGLYLVNGKKILVK